MIGGSSLRLFLASMLLLAEAGSLSAQSAPKTSSAVERYAAQLVATIAFGEDASALSEEARAQLDAALDRLLLGPADRVQLLGFAGGNRELVSVNRRLSLERALAVRQHLLARGIPAGRIDVRAMGSTRIGDTSLERVDVVLGISPLPERQESRK